jgi:predicted nucleic acid-binding protein
MRSNSGKLIISQLAVVEMTALTARRLKASSLPKSTAARVRSQLNQHLQHKEYMMVELSKEAVENSIIMARKHSLRALDAIQLGCAELIRTRLGVPVTFITSDKELRNAAQAEKFTIDDPMLYP